MEREPIESKFEGGVVVEHERKGSAHQRVGSSVTCVLDRVYTSRPAVRAFLEALQLSYFPISQLAICTMVTACGRQGSSFQGSRRGTRG
jgi:hypothetical protein